jgi:hypothetical protein
MSDSPQDSPQDSPRGPPVYAAKGTSGQTAQGRPTPGSAEELEALKKFAESKMYITSGTSGTFPNFYAGRPLSQEMVWGDGWSEGNSVPDVKPASKVEKDKERKSSIMQTVKSLFSSSSKKEEKGESSDVIH